MTDEEHAATAALGARRRLRLTDHGERYCRRWAAFRLACSKRGVTDLRPAGAPNRPTKPATIPAPLARELRRVVTEELVVTLRNDGRTLRELVDPADMAPAGGRAWQTGPSV